MQTSTRLALLVAATTEFPCRTAHLAGGHDPRATPGARLAFAGKLVTNRAPLFLQQADRLGVFLAKAGWGGPRIRYPLPSAKPHPVFWAACKRQKFGWDVLWRPRREKGCFNVRTGGGGIHAKLLVSCKHQQHTSLLRCLLACSWRRWSRTSGKRSWHR
jgi:hypothetical protein